MTQPLVRISDLRVSATTEGHRIDIVRGVSLDVDRGEAVAIIGESGSGKSITARCISKLLPRNFTTTGTITFDGIDVLTTRGAQLRELRAQRLSLITQDPRA